jgi:hypothetical protein
MGASGWQYFVPYQSDIKKALNELREQVFQSGKYYKRAPFWQYTEESEYDDAPDEDARQELIQWLRRMKAMKEPTTIEELFQWNEEDGTHSILDVKDVSDAPDFGTISPLSPEELISLFGTSEPTKAMVEQKADEIMGLRERWQGTYVILYEDGLPNEIFITGFSGD